MAPVAASLSNQFLHYSYHDGTSFAVPHVVGVLALLSARYPADNYLQRLGRLLAGVDAVSGLQAKTVTGGRLNAAKALSQTTVVTLLAVRKTGIGWMVERDTGWLRLEVAPDSLGRIAGGRLVVQRKEAGKSFADIRTVAAADLTGGTLEFFDKYLDRDKKYTYRALLYSSGGQLVGSSNQPTI
jgi:subtilisin family serine protease